MKSWLLSDGRRLAYREAGEGRPLVLLHGWSMSSAVFNEALRALAGDFRLLVPDLRGHGASDPGNAYGLDDFAGDLRHWLDGLGVTGFDLLGWSLGGQVALRLGSLAGNHLGKLLLVAATPCFVAREGWTAGLPAGQVKAMTRGLRRRYRETLDDFFAGQFAKDEVSPARMAEIRAFAAPAVDDETAAAPILAALETLQATDMREELGAIKVPTLVLHGERDGIIPVDAGRYLADRLQLGRFVGFEDTGHAPFLSRPERCFELIRGFCRP
jgi:pimeloyl-[acyl-carrier protein] methyl ester esterase